MAEEKPSFKKLKEFHLRKGRYPIRVSLTLWNDGKSKPYIELYSGVPSKKGYKNNNFKIKNQKIWNKIKSIIDNDLIYEIRKSKPLTEKDLEEIENEEIEIIKKDNLRLKKRLQNYSKLIKEYHQIRLPEYKKEVKDFEKLLKTAKKEDELQDFLSKNPWFLGLEYENSQPQKIGVGKRYDFYVERYDGYADIIEIKKVSDNLFNKNGKMSSELNRALQQLIEYIDEAIVEGDSKKISKKFKINFLKPKGILIISRTKNQEERDKIENISYYFHNIRIMSYDNILERAKIVLKHLEGKNETKTTNTK